MAVESILFQAQGAKDHPVAFANHHRRFRTKLLLLVLLALGQAVDLRFMQRINLFLILTLLREHPPAQCQFSRPAMPRRLLACSFVSVGNVIAFS
jgi:hypothetical protein